MHSATAIGAGRGEYYLSLGRDDYYLEGGEPPGQWYGRGCEELGLSGEVQKTEFRNLLAGRSADCRDELVKKQHFIKPRDGTQKEACAAYDLHFSVPKSVSVLWAMAPDHARSQIASCHDRAVKFALDVLEEEASFGRKGKGGTESLPAKMAVAIFQHGASRALDPQLHHHAVVLNIACCEDGTRALDGRHFYRWQKCIGSVYDAELSRLLHEEMRLRVVKKGQSFELDGVSQPACEVFSKRRAEILEMAGKSSHPAVREIAALETRETKANVSDEKRREMWLTLGPDIGFGRKEAEALLKQPQIAQDDKETLKQEAFDSALKRLSQNESHFNTRDFYHALSQEAQSRHLGPMLQEARNFLADSPDVIRLGLIDGELRYGTRELWDVEAQFIKAVEDSLKDTRHKVDIYAFGRGLQAFEREKTTAIGKTFRLNDEQIEAVREITLEEGSVKAITGMAGTGKTTMLGAATRIWQEAGLEVIGTALAGKAATGLKEETGMEAASVAKTLSLIERKRLTITERTVLVVDEAAMVDTYKAAKLTEAVTRNGGKLVLVGDSDQLQAIGPGGAFRN